MSRGGKVRGEGGEGRGVGGEVRRGAVEARRGQGRKGGRAWHGEERGVQGMEWAGQSTAAGGGREMGGQGKGASRRSDNASPCSSVFYLSVREPREIPEENTLPMCELSAKQFELHLAALPSGCGCSQSSLESRLRSLLALPSRADSQISERAQLPADRAMRRRRSVQARSKGEGVNEGEGVGEGEGEDYVGLR